MRPEVIKNKRIRRHNRVRGKIFGTQKRPRLSVFRSSKHLYLQLIDDEAGKTIAATSSKEFDAKLKKLEQAEKAGSALAEKAKKAGITEAVFDRGGFLYHGRVKAAAEAARKAGLKF